jgi:hypothetical protein
MKYETLLRIIDQLRREAPEKQASRYRPLPSDSEMVNAARSRCFIHLYFKVLFGILDFQDREKYITDGSFDGGIDGYYIDEVTKTIYLIQSKFRNTQRNFETKKIEIEEILCMDVNRILNGESGDENGNEYNGKIKQLQREISGLPDIARYRYRVVLIANVKHISEGKLKQLTGGYPVDVFDFGRCYDDLVFPVISGTYFTAGDIRIPIDLSNKNAGSKISYTVATKISDCEITVLFVPTIEIAKIMSSYKNSILKYNPRSYLDLEGKSVNSAIRDTITKTDTNEFALFNNGITMLSDETYINERIGQKNKAQLTVKNPQIINGGQTSYTLSRIYDDAPVCERDRIFHNKEVLLKVITLIDNRSHEAKLQLIDEVSNATNKQTPVINADRFANELLHQKIQRKVFDRYGLLYERKRGEFSDGLRSSYVDAETIIERNLFLRIFYSANGKISKGVQKKLFQRNDFPDLDLDNDTSFDRFYLGLCAFKRLVKSNNPQQPVSKTIYAMVFAYVQLFFSEPIVVYEDIIDENLVTLDNLWKIFLEAQKKLRHRNNKIYLDAESGDVQVSLKSDRLINSNGFEGALRDFFTNVRGRGPEDA